ncbi:MAG: hypothetical protein QGH94_16550 [Phycisphaerae bacterium]|jgi:hypothetical protein|nr:hypothetical protein [Phycisphaerae bacterium]MDP7289593.1 hypothetical protein [Phycisphaerae bacterium]
MGKDDGGIDGEHTDQTLCTRRSFLSAGGAAAAGLWLSGCSPAADDTPSKSVPPVKSSDIDLTDRAPGAGPKRDLTFFIAADTHFGYKGMAELNRR